MENNNMITIRGFKMSGKFGDVTLEELTLPCTKEAWDILGNLSDVASDAAEECLDTSEFKASTESETITGDNGVKKVRARLTMESLKVLFNSFNMIPASGSFTYKNKFETNLGESVYVRISLYPAEYDSSISISVDFYSKGSAISTDLKVSISQREVHNKLLDRDADYIKTVIDSLDVTDTTWLSFKDKFLELLYNQNYRKFMTNF